MSIKRDKGITLIALVITIIVLLILAGVTINMILGDDGIIANVQTAKKESEESSLKEAVSVAKADAKTYKYLKQTTMNVTDLNNALGTSKEENKTVAKVVDGVPIPIGFAYVEGTKKDTGLIVVDRYGNEFVWVPVKDFSKMFRKYGDNYAGVVSDFHMGNFGNEPSDGELNHEDITYDIMRKEYDDMAKSIETYKGFYVGRYETSWTGSRVASIENVEPLNGNTPVETIDSNNNGEGDILGSNWYTFYFKQKELYNKESDSVVSGMIYGVQWDAIITWMSDVKNVKDNSKLYVHDSTDMGHYNSSSPIKTGSKSEYSVKNIFDLAGNYTEWTQQGCEGVPERMCCGGKYEDNGNNYPAAIFEEWGTVDEIYDNMSSRLQIYIK